MRSVVLLGDSIRLGYQPVVRELLADCAVWGPEENGQTSAWTLAHLDDWALARRPALLHLNCGLWDLRRDFGSTEHSVPLADYRRNVAAILARARPVTQGPVLWATITPVNEAWHNARKPFARFEGDVAAYNDVALVACREQGVAVNDLHRVVTDAGRDRLLDADGVHYTDEGYRLLGAAVAAAIRQHLAG